MHLQTEIDYFNERIEYLRTDHSGEWVVVAGRYFVGFFVSFEKAAIKASQELGDKDYLIRQVDAPRSVMPFVSLADE